ncbi:MAG: response regulator [Actinomycetota bacterium]
MKHTPMADAPLIAVIEDEATVLMATMVMLESLGFGVVGGEGLDAVMEQLRMVGRWPDAIVADYRLRHGRTGIEAICAIRAAADRLVPALVVTGDTSLAWKSQAADARLPVLQKPVSPSSLVAAVRRAVGAGEPGHGAARP